MTELPPVVCLGEEAEVQKVLEQESVQEAEKRQEEHQGTIDLLVYCVVLPVSMGSALTSLVMTSGISGSCTWAGGSVGDWIGELRTRCSGTVGLDERFLGLYCGLSGS